MTTDFRRTLLLVVFSMSLVFLWDKWNIQNGHASMFSAKAPAAAAAAASVPAPATTAGFSTAEPAPAAVAAVAAATPASGAASGALPELKSEPVTVKTDVVEATFDTRGGDLVSLQLLKYKDMVGVSPCYRILGIVPVQYYGDSFFQFRFSCDEEHATPKGNIHLFTRVPGRVYVAQTGLAPGAGASAPLPYHGTVMKLASTQHALEDGQDTLKVRFESPDVSGVQYVKTYVFKRGDYAVGVTHEVVNHGAAPVSPQLYLRLVRDAQIDPGSTSMGQSSYTGPAIDSPAKNYQRLKFADIDKELATPQLAAENRNPAGKNIATESGWVAMVQHYFASAWLIPGNATRSFEQDKLPSDIYGVAAYSVGMVTPVGTVAPGASKSIETTLYAGPQEENRLKDLAPHLELVKDYSWLAILAVPMFKLLSTLHTLIGNWGWTIVALVVCLKIAFYWLNASAYRSMGKMKALNPRIQAMRETYKDKPQQMQQEMMRIYREEKVNPLGGCLPIVVQMPFFISLYWVLLATVELRGAPWLGWITDLSVRDPYFILPLLMTGTSMVQTWLQPTPADPMQARMMWIMPLAFSVMFFVFPSGLVLYWLTNNLLTITQQWFINRQLAASVNKSA
jgi:YidC/Oxa1 family membrane protein insertase